MEDPVSFNLKRAVGILKMAKINKIIKDLIMDELYFNKENDLRPVALKTHMILHWLEV